jgi:hypothetical protein
MAISLIDYTIANSDGSSTDRDIRFAKPSGADGDMFVVVIGSTNQGSITRSGWTTVQSPDKGGPDRQIRMMMKVITNYAAESSSLDFRNTDSVFMQGILMCLRGADITAPTFVRQGQGDDDPVNANSQCPSVLTTFDNAFIVACTAIVDTSGRPGSDPFGSVSGTPTATIILDGVPAGGGDAHLAENGSDHYYVKTGVAYAQQTVAGSAGGYGFYVPNVPGSPDELRDGAEICMTVAIKPHTGGGGGGCTCNAICDNDCAANYAVCTGHVPYCSNTFSFTAVGSGTLILAAHLRELESAINAERNDTGRRFNAANPTYCSAFTAVACTNNDFPAFPFSGGLAGDVKTDDDTDDVIQANNEVSNGSGYGGVVPSDPSAGDLISYLMYTGIQAKINETRVVCICDSHCSCNPADCGCNGECPSDDYSYYYYP